MMIKNIIIKGARHIVGQAVLNKASELYADYANNVNSKETLVNRSKAQYILFAKLRLTTIKRGFFVTDENNEKKYSVKTGFSFLSNQSIKLYDSKGKSIGYVNISKNIITKKKRYKVFTDNKLIGEINRKLSLGMNWDFTIGKERLNVTGNFLRSHYTVLDSMGKTIISIHEAYEERDTYVIEYFDFQHEVIGLLIMMAIELVHSGN